MHSALGRSPASAWAAAMVDGPAVARLPADPAALVLDFLPFERRVVRRDGVRLFDVAYFDGALAPLVGTGTACRVKYDPRDMGAVYAELPDGAGHVRAPCGDLGRPPVSLWEQRAATRALREVGRNTADEAAVLAAVEEQRRVLAAAQASSKAARRALARLPPTSPATGPAGPLPSSDEAPAEAGEEEARVPPVVEADAWRIEFLP